jgi:hypothetical protein
MLFGNCLEGLIADPSASRGVNRSPRSECRLHRSGYEAEYGCRPVRRDMAQVDRCGCTASIGFSVTTAMTEVSVDKP